MQYVEEAERSRRACRRKLRDRGDGGEGSQATRGRSRRGARAGGAVRRPRRRSRPAGYRLLKGLGIGALLLAVAAAWGVFGYARYYAVGRLKGENPGLTSMMRYKLEASKAPGKNIRQVWVPLAEISPVLVDAVVSAEDDRFFEHRGFDREALEQAARLYWRSGVPRRGGSTITQQLAKNLYLTPERSLTRKIHEAAITASLERRLDKRRIIEIYLNVIELGPNLYGVEAASRAYFRKPARRIAADEAVLMVSAIPAPVKRNPAVPSCAHLKRARQLLYRLKVEGSLGEDEWRAARERLSRVRCSR